MDNKQKILMIGDSAVHCHDLVKMLSDRCCFTVARDGQHALKILTQKNEEFDAVMLDLVTPVMDSYAFLQSIRENSNFAAIPILVLAQEEDPSAELRVLQLGASDFIYQSCEPAVICQRLFNLLRLREAAAHRNSSERDDLTGVYNKDTFYRRASKRMKLSKDSFYDIICVDIEQFKLINDLFGVSEGDKLLCYVARTLRRAMNSSESLLGRVGPDIFAICTPRANSYNRTLVAYTVDAVKNYPLDFSIALRFGVYQVDDTEVPVNAMCDRANLAIRSIKGQYNRYLALYDDSHRQQLLEEQEITSEMYDALLKKQFKAYFQPKYNLTTGDIIGAEALVRWQHPQKGIITPDKFLPLFERNGFITSLDIYIWEQTCRQIRRWMDAGNEPIPISVNISRVDIYNPSLCGILQHLLKRHNLEPRLLELEITETAYTQNADQLIKVVRQLKNLGFVVQMDDFGSGYSSLNMLNEVPVDVIKLDMHFLNNKPKTSDREGNILNFVMDLAKWMNLPLVAEGIETREQAAYLRGMGCNRGQGYYFSPPLPEKEFEELLERSKVKPNQNKPAFFYSNISLAEIWDPSSSFNLIFNSYIGALAIYEFMDNKLSFIRGNDKYYEVLGAGCDDVFARSLDMLSLIHPQDKAKLVNLLKKAQKGKLEEGCDIRWKLPKNKNYRWYRRHFRLIFEADNRCLFLGSMEDITMQHELENQLQIQHDFYEKLYDTLPLGIGQFSLENGFRFFNGNTAIANLFGLSKAQFWKKRHSLGDFICPQYLDYIHAHRQEMKELVCGQTIELEYEITSADGKTKWIHDATQKLKNKDGTTYYQCVLTDITIQKKRGEQLRLSEEQYLIAVKNSNNYIFRYDIAARRAITLSQDDDSLEQKVLENIPESYLQNGNVANESLDEYKRFYDRIIRGERQGEAKLCIKLRSGEYRWFRGQFFNQFGEDGKPLQAVCVFSDITTIKQQAAMLYDASRREALTGLYNRIAFEEIVSARLGELEPGKTYAFFMLDIDSFKNINDTYGHMFGDDAIVSLAQTLKDVMHKNDVIARLGGDEFAILMDGIYSPQAALKKGNQILQTFARANQKYGLTCSVGVAIIPDHGCCFGSLYSKADKALYEAKHLGKNQCCMFHPQLLESDVF